MLPQNDDGVGVLLGYRGYFSIHVNIKDRGGGTEVGADQLMGSISFELPVGIFKLKFLLDLWM